jgi:type IV pilus assembly protein PilB
MPAVVAADISVRVAVNDCEDDQTMPSSEMSVADFVRGVADLLSMTQLVPDDRLSSVRDRAIGTGSLPQALVEEGVATTEGIARMLAARHGLPLVDLSLSGVDEGAAKLIPLRVLERTTAIPFALRGNTLSVALADPSDVYAIDELRMAARHPIETSVAPRDQIISKIETLTQRTDITDTIRKLAALVDDGLITSDEFDAKKRQLLGL